MSPFEDVPPDTANQASRLPPGQRAVAGFPRFGTQLHRPAPPPPEHPRLVVDRGGAAVLDLPLTELMAQLRRHEQVSDLHCVAGWSAVGLRWLGAAFADFWRRLVQPALPSGAPVTHVVLVGLDTYRIVVVLQDLLAPDVLLADRLDGQPLGGDHGGPLRLVRSSQYACVSAKHLCRIELHECEPPENFGGSWALTRALADAPAAVQPAPAVEGVARGAERHAADVGGRPVYRLLIPPLRLLNRLGAREAGSSDGR